MVSTLKWKSRDSSVPTCVYLVVSISDYGDYEQQFLRNMEGAGRPPKFAYLAAVLKKLLHRKQRAFWKIDFNPVPSSLRTIAFAIDDSHTPML